jgi:hemerythrin-like domain-containing protein
MYMVHTAFRREFGALPGLVRSVKTDFAERSHVIAEHIEILSNFLDAHHRAEDAHLWPKLLDRGSREVALLVRLMEGQHENLEWLNSESFTAAREWRVDGTQESQDALAGILDRLIYALTDHMKLEERSILPLVEKYVTAAEWRDMASESGRIIRQEHIPLVFGMTLYEANPDVIRKTLSELPPEARSVLKTRGPQEFAAHSKRVHGTATPPRSGAVLRGVRTAW